MIKAEKKLAVVALGNKNAGKSNTWYKIFNQENIPTIRRLRQLHFNKKEYVHVFLLNGSMEERKREIDEELIDCDILLCSVQYNEKGKKTIEYLHKQGYQWLNPGCEDKQQYTDYLSIIQMINSYPNSTVKQCKAIKDDSDTKVRSDEIIQFIYEWARKEDIILS
ncbi:hypothetical protein [Cytobacillus praedii]|uniref:hypothetical protein n=1 Tax=Cytobacillus praedii TaxID=1742358 RepID=UPI000711110F|nr:hypothetical protein [Cytobacillus praedii]